MVGASFVAEVGQVFRHGGLVWEGGGGRWVGEGGGGEVGGGGRRWGERGMLDVGQLESWMEMRIRSVEHWTVWTIICVEFVFVLVVPVCSRCVPLVAASTEWDVVLRQATPRHPTPPHPPLLPPTHLPPLGLLPCLPIK